MSVGAQRHGRVDASGSGGGDDRRGDRRRRQHSANGHEGHRVVWLNAEQPDLQESHVGSLAGARGIAQGQFLHVGPCSVSKVDVPCVYFVNGLLASRHAGVDQQVTLPARAITDELRKIRFVVEPGLGGGDNNPP